MPMGYNDPPTFSMPALLSAALHNIAPLQQISGYLATSGYFRIFHHFWIFRIFCNFSGYFAIFQDIFQDYKFCLLRLLVPPAWVVVELKCIRGIERVDLKMQFS
jgi:hypothetical protein